MDLMAGRLAHDGESRVKSTLPNVAPPVHVPLMLPVGQIALAARTQPSQRPLEMLMVASVAVARRVNSAVPERPTVLWGEPPHFVMVPAMPSQMLSSATFWSWKTMFLYGFIGLITDLAERMLYQILVTLDLHVRVYTPHFGNR